MKAPANESWIEHSVALLEHSAQSLDATTLGRLNRARQAALTQRRRSWHSWAIGSGLAGATVALIVAFGLGDRTPKAPLNAPDALQRSVADAATLTSDDTLDLYENLDFYVWLNAEQHGNN